MDRPSWHVGIGDQPETGAPRCSGSVDLHGGRRAMAMPGGPQVRSPAMPTSSPSVMPRWMLMYLRNSSPRTASRGGARSATSLDLGSRLRWRSSCARPGSGRCSTRALGRRRRFPRVRIDDRRLDALGRGGIGEVDAPSHRPAVDLRGRRDTRAEQRQKIRKRSSSYLPNADGGSRFQVFRTASP